MKPSDRIGARVGRLAVARMHRGFGLFHLHRRDGCSGGNRHRTLAQRLDRRRRDRMVEA
jgi:hypothetical protein